MGVKIFYKKNKERDRFERLGDSVAAGLAAGLKAAEAKHEPDYDKKAAEAMERLNKVISGWKPYKEVNTVTVRWHDGYMETFRATEVRFGSDLLWMRLEDGTNRHIPLRSVRWFGTSIESHQSTGF